MYDTTTLIKIKKVFAWWNDLENAFFFLKSDSTYSYTYLYAQRVSCFTVILFLLVFRGAVNAYIVR